MNGKNIHDAVEFVGCDLIHRAETRRYGRPIWHTILPAAAMVTLLLGIGAFLPKPAHTPALSAPAESIAEEAHSPTVPAEPPETVHPLIEQFPMLREIPSSLQPETDWASFYLNEAGLEDHGTDCYTIHNDQVLAIDARNGILLIRIQGDDYQGVLAVANDPTRLSLQASSQIGTSGETIGTIAEAHRGVLAVNASRFSDDSNGAYPQLYTMCDGTAYNEELLIHDGQARLEIDSHGQFSIVSPAGPLGDDVQHAVQGIPSMIINGEVTSELEDWNGIHPRSCIGQTEDGTVLILVIEGRMTDRSLGTGLVECAEILMQYGAVQAMSLDYGSSSILWYDGEYVTKCSISILTEGRQLPNAFVLERAE